MVASRRLPQKLLIIRPAVDHGFKLFYKQDLHLRQRGKSLSCARSQA